MVKRWTPPTLTLLAWLLAALCTSFWALHFVRSPGLPAGAVDIGAAPAAAVDSGDIARLLGPGAPSATAPEAIPVAPADQLVLLGVVAGRSAQGVALIAVNGKPPRPYRVGNRIEDRYLLQSVAARSAVLAREDKGGGALTLELAPQPGATSGPRPALAIPGTGQAAPAMPAQAAPATPPVFMPGAPGAPPVFMPGVSPRSAGPGSGATAGDVPDPATTQRGG